MTPVVNDPVVCDLRLRSEGMRRTVHFGHPPGKYLLCVIGENSSVPGTYVFGAGQPALRGVFWSPGDILFVDPYSAVEASPCFEPTHREALLLETAPPVHQSPFAGLDAVIAAIRESRPLPALTPEVADLVAQAVGLQGTAPTDIDEWARQLASDVANLTD
jgi:hypothetical protein